MRDITKTIFLIDDNLTNLEVGVSSLAEFYDVFTFGSGELMFRALDRGLKPDLILLDIEMPYMDGYEVIERLKCDVFTSDIPVIFLTGLSKNDNEYKGLSLGAIDYITKPFSPPLLLKRVEIHLLVESQKQQLISYNTNLEKTVKERTKTISELKNALLGTLAELVEHRDEITGGHIERTQRYVKVLFGGMKAHGVYQAEMKGVDEDLMLQSCQLHDIGKISIRDSILFKPGKLTAEEFEEMKKHAAFGANIIQGIMKRTSDSVFLEYAKIFAESHHEKWDGSGYPKGLKGDDIPLFGRLMAIADVYDALVTTRPYKTAFTHTKAVEIILDGKGSHFDPALIDLFMKLHEEFEEVAKDVAAKAMI